MYAIDRLIKLNNEFANERMDAPGCQEARLNFISFDLVAPDFAISLNPHGADYIRLAPTLKFHPKA